MPGKEASFLSSAGNSPELRLAQSILQQALPIQHTTAQLPGTKVSTSDYTHGLLTPVHGPASSFKRIAGKAGSPHLQRISGHMPRLSTNSDSPAKARPSKAAKPRLGQVGKLRRLLDSSNSWRQKGPSPHPPKPPQPTTGCRLQMTAAYWGVSLCFLASGTGQVCKQAPEQRSSWTCLQQCFVQKKHLCRRARFTGIFG